MKIDMEELQKQRREEILNKGNYLRIEIIVPRIETSDVGTIPVIEVKQKGGNAFTILGALQCLEDVKNSLIERHPEVLILRNLYKAKTKPIQEEGEEDE